VGSKRRGPSGEGTDTPGGDAVLGFEWHIAGEASKDCQAGDNGISGDGPDKAALNAATLGEGAKSARLSPSSSLSSPSSRDADEILPAVGRVNPRMLSPPPGIGVRWVGIRRGRVGVSSISTLILGTIPIPIPSPAA